MSECNCEKLHALQSEFEEYKKKIEKCHSWTTNFIMENGRESLAMTLGQEVIQRFKNKEHTFKEPFGDGEQTVLYVKYCIT